MSESKVLTMLESYLSAELAPFGMSMAPIRRDSGPFLDIADAIQVNDQYCQPVVRVRHPYISNGPPPVVYLADKLSVSVHSVDGDGVLSIRKHIVDVADPESFSRIACFACVWRDFKWMGRGLKDKPRVLNPSG